MYKVLLIVLWYFIIITKSYLLNHKLSTKGTFYCTCVPNVVARSNPISAYRATQVIFIIRKIIPLFHFSVNCKVNKSQPENEAVHCRYSTESSLFLSFQSTSVTNFQDTDASLQLFTFPQMWKFFNFLFAVTEISLHPI